MESADHIGPNERDTRQRGHPQCELRDHCENRAFDRCERHGCFIYVCPMHSLHCLKCNRLFCLNCANQAEIEDFVCQYCLEAA
jgi:hypothetical protein